MSQAGEDLREYYPERETPYDAYEARANLLLRVAMRNPAELSRELTRLTDVFSTEGPLQLENSVRELLYGWGIPAPVLEQLDPAGAYGLSFSYPIRHFTGETWAQVPAKDVDALARALVDWLTLDKVDDKVWKSDPGEEEPGRELDADHTREGIYVQQGQGVVSFALRRPMLDNAGAPKSADGKVHDLLVELDGVATASEDLLEDFDMTLHNTERETWRARIEAVDRAWLTVDAQPDKDMEFGIGLEGRLDGWDGGLLGPARTQPARIADALPAGAVVAATMSWGNPAPALELIDDFRPSLAASALERDYLELASQTVDHIVEDVGVALYVDPAGKHTLMVAATVDAPSAVDQLAVRFVDLLDRSMRAYDAGITAQEVSGELSAEDAKSKRRKFSKSKVTVGKHKARAFWVEMDDTEGKMGIVLDDKSRFHATAFVHGDTLFILVGPGLDAVAKRIGNPRSDKLSKSPGLLQAHAQFDGCQVCGMSDGGLAARSLFGRAARSLTPERRAEARGLLPKLDDGGQGMFMLKTTPARVDAMFVTDRARVAADPEKAAAWEAFMRALGHRGEALTDPRQWLFG